MIYYVIHNVSCQSQAIPLLDSINCLKYQLIIQKNVLFRKFISTFQLFNATLKMNNIINL
jgi:hypothetical protein